MAKKSAVKRQKLAKKRDWRDLREGFPGNPTLKKRGRRNWLAYGKGLALGALALAAFGSFIALVATGEAYLADKNKAVAVSSGPEITFLSDGMLTREWFLDTFSGELPTDLRGFDVHQFKKRIENAEKQVASVRVQVALPSAVQVHVRERKPVGRILIRGEDGPEVWLIGEDGVLFAGRGYLEESLRRVPVLAGIRLRRAGGEFLPVEGFEEVAQFLTGSRELYPELVDSWKVVDLRGWNPEDPYDLDRVHVRSRDADTIVLHVGRSLRPQLARLAAVLTTLRSEGLQRPEAIDVSFDNRAVVTVRDR